MGYRSDSIAVLRDMGPLASGGGGGGLPKKPHGGHVLKGLRDSEKAPLGATQKKLFFEHSPSSLGCWSLKPKESNVRARGMAKGNHNVVARICELQTQPNLPASGSSPSMSLQGGANAGRFVPDWAHSQGWGVQIRVGLEVSDNCKFTGVAMGMAADCRCVI